MDALAEKLKLGFPLVSDPGNAYGFFFCGKSFYEGLFGFFSVCRKRNSFSAGQIDFVQRFYLYPIDFIQYAVFFEKLT